MHTDEQPLVLLVPAGRGLLLLLSRSSKSPSEPSKLLPSLHCCRCSCSPLFLRPVLCPATQLLCVPA